ncbi:hypothetical protein [Mesorhizobium loti]|uniref:hypothetical protein n=1 Tax=Rhizobium loti TaxID=381 RepID=UPI0012693198|nr:hypothetical protein [Mesorhizobium loti]
MEDPRHNVGGSPPPTKADELQRRRDEWLFAENVRTESYRAFMDANKNSPFRHELNAAEVREKAAHDRYKRALQTNNESLNNDHH